MSNRNKTLVLNDTQVKGLAKKLCLATKPLSVKEVLNNIYCQDMLTVAKFLPRNFVDILFLDPPYNLTKSFNGTKFAKRDLDDYSEVLDKWLSAIMHTLKPSATIYICSDWLTSAAVYTVASKHFYIRNRITWEREKGRGALSNWKNCSEDIWFCTKSKDYYFDVESVKLKKKVIAPYRNKNGEARDWNETDSGNYRMTSPSNLWTDITVPFWSMPENTDHPTQKPEKLLAKLILASSKCGDTVFDPFLGSGTTAVVAKKLGRNFVGVEQEKKYSCYAVHRINRAEADKAIQGYRNGVFWERNSLVDQKKSHLQEKKKNSSERDLFGVAA